MYKYELLKDLPDLNAGAEFEFYLDNGIAKIFSCGRHEYTEFIMQDRPDWFKKIEYKDGRYLGRIKQYNIVFEGSTIRVNCEQIRHIEETGITVFESQKRESGTVIGEMYIITVAPKNALITEVMK